MSLALANGPYQNTYDSTTNVTSVTVASVTNAAGNIAIACIAVANGAATAVSVSGISPGTWTKAKAVAGQAGVDTEIWTTTSTITAQTITVSFTGNVNGALIVIDSLSGQNGVGVSTASVSGTPTNPPKLTATVGTASWIYCAWIDYMGGGITPATPTNVTTKYGYTDGNTGDASGWVTVSGPYTGSTQVGYATPASDSTYGVYVEIKASSGNVTVNNVDSSAGSDVNQVAAKSAGVDSSSGTDTGKVGVTALETDSSAGADTGSVAVRAAQVDASAGLDSSLVAVLVAHVDSSVGSDSNTATLSGGSYTSNNTDSSGGSDSGAVAVTAAQADTTSGTDASASLVSVANADSSVCVDSNTVTITTTHIDSSMGSDGTALTVTAAQSDTTVGADSNTLASTVACVDSSAGSDANTVSGGSPGGPVAVAAQMHGWLFTRYRRRGLW